jgi:predicted GNAT family acetyltransferase
VVENDWLGLFSIATLSEYRRQGAASSVVAALCSWGLSKGAKSAYLQVESRNQPALEMYEKTGFKSLYTYWHRMLRADT